MKNIWYGVLIATPAYCFYSATNQYGYVNGVYQRLPFSFSDGMIGFFTGVVLSGILYGLTRLFVMIRARLRK